MIDLLPSDDQQQILDAARTLLSVRFSPDRLRGRDLDPAIVGGWLDLVEFGWFLLGLSEEEGGAGLGVAEEMLLFREAGRFLLPPSVLATSLAAHLAAGAGERGLVETLTSGTRAGLAIAIEDGVYLIDAETADYALMVDPASLRLFPRGAFGDLRRVPSLDEAVSLERGAVPTGGATAAGQSRSLARRAEFLAAAVLVGLAEASVELAVEYAKIRQQFGQPIGAFQAIKHRCADMAVRAEIAGAQAAMAALEHQENGPDADYQVLCAARTALQAARQNSADCIQVHGGMGFTAETHGHRYLKRSHVLAQLLGGTRSLEQRLLATPAPR